jgi:cell division protein FtsW
MKHNKEIISGYINDPFIWVPTLLLISFGLLMVASASLVVSDQQYGYPFHYFLRQLIYVVLALILGGIAKQFPVAFWQKNSMLFILASLFLLLMVLVPGIGSVINGSRRWFHLGILSLQVSEIMKLCIILYMASYIERFEEEFHTHLSTFFRPLVLLGVIVVLLLLEPDFGTATVITMTVLAMLFIAGARIWPFTALLIIAASGLTFLAIDSPYRLERLTTFLDPWKTAYGPGYQLTQSLIAFGRGGLWGVGLGNSIQKLFYLPEAHTDFIFAVIGEELGLIGELLFIFLFLMLVIRILKLSRLASQKGQVFAAYVAFGSGVWLALQAMVNIGVNIGLLPTKGLTLPFISYGGSSMLINCILIGIILRIAYETNQQ